MASRIEDYALIGDCETAALVGKDGSIDWLCWPRFDSPACFAALLGEPEQGRWQIAPAGTPKKIERQYRKSTLILETQFETDDGAVTVVDFMAMREKQSDVVRIVRGVRGKVPMRMLLSLRFDYGRSIPWVTREDDGTLRAIAGPNMAALRTPAEIRGESMQTVAEFTVSAGESVPFVLSYRKSNRSLPERLDPEKSFEKTESFWLEWACHCTYQGTWANAVERSLITLKALTHLQTGGILAAATTSLPEKIKGPRNWDYRFCWLRDASFTLSALMRAGHFDEAAEWQNWLLRAVAGSPNQVQVLYGLAAERDLPERELSWLHGYERSGPVRVGNAASEQLQLDVYGEIAAVFHNAFRGNLGGNDPEVGLHWALLEHLEKIWQEPDEGIWEVRGPRQHFVHSKVMAWVAFDRAIQSCEQFGLEGPVDRWRKVRQEIHDEVCEKGFDLKLNSFVQAYESKNLDAALLMIPRSGFLPATDPRVVGTIAAIEKDLLRGGFVLRYDSEETEDGLPPGEGAFLPCSFWLADAYFLSGREKEARELFERLLKLQNDVGLLSEEYDPEEQRQLGNFPQALSHVALVNTAFALDRVLRPAAGAETAAPSDAKRP
jgi:GH15 family glucan-1,4-alpha-glucosidase